VASATVRTIGEPASVKQAPATGYQAQFSGPYVVAAALFGGSGLGLGLPDFTDELAQDPDRRELMSRIHVVADADCDEIYPDEFPAILRVRTRDGTELVKRVMSNRGGAQRPLTDDELAGKFSDNVEGILDESQAARAVDVIGRFPDCALSDLLDALSSTP
jgi:2-methylcitrate dehydratase PrpD